MNLVEESVRNAEQKKKKRTIYKNTAKKGIIKKYV